MRKICMVIAVALLLAGCGGPDTREVKETRVVAAPSAEVPQGHGMDSLMSGASSLPAGHPPMAAYAWDVPAGWTEIAATPMRIGNFKVDASVDTECYLTVLTGAAGGVDANLNRWRRQMGQADLSAAEVEALPKMEVLGRPSVMVEIEGAFTGMTGQQHMDYLLVGLVCPLGDETLFVKMTGPKDAVAAERERFQAFCQSLREGGAPDEASAQASQ